MDTMIYVTMFLFNYRFLELININIIIVIINNIQHSFLSTIPAYVGLYRTHFLTNLYSIHTHIYRVSQSITHI